MPQGEGSDRHKWYVYPDMEATEGIVFVNYDSDPTAPQFVFHGACDLQPEQPPSSAQQLQSAAAGEQRPEVASGEAVGEDSSGGEREDSRARTSVEVRLLVIIERDGQHESRSRVCGTKGLWPAPGEAGLGAIQ